MSQSQHPVYGNPKRRMEILPFAIYSCVSQETFDAAVSAIEDNEDLKPSSRTFRGSPVSEIVAFHRGRCQTENSSIDPFLIIIVDKQDFEQYGVLVANLDVYKDPSWKVGYMRQPTSEVGAILPSINIGNTDWEEVLDNTEFGIQWDRYFAKYPTNSSFETAEKPVQEFWDVDRQFQRALEGPERQRFRTWQVRKEGTLWRGDDVADIARPHAVVADSDPKYHESLLVWFDIETWICRQEIAVVRLVEGSDAPETRTLPVAEAANLLVDIAMGHRKWE